MHRRGYRRGRKLVSVLAWALVVLFLLSRRWWLFCSSGGGNEMQQMRLRQWLKKGEWWRIRKRWIQECRQHVIRSIPLSLRRRDLLSKNYQQGINRLHRNCQQGMDMIYKNYRQIIGPNDDDGCRMVSQSCMCLFETFIATLEL